MDYRVLGGLEVRDGARPLDLGPPKQRAVLAVLLLEAGRVVAADRLVELLWGEDAPKAMASLQAYVSHLRRILEPDRKPRDEATVLVTQAPGYRLVVDRQSVDAWRFEDLVAAGREQLLAGDAAAARATLDDALALWSGPPLPELADEPFAVEATERLVAHRAGALEAAAEARLSLGDHAGAIALLEPEADAHPLRERLHGLLALGLYRAGRQADALRAVDRCRRALADAAGLDPGPELRRLEADLLAQSPDLDWQPPPTPIGLDSAPKSAHGEARFGGRGAVGAPIVGRAGELRSLTDALEGACAGRGGVAVVVGEAGIGKTRLVEELTAEAARRGVVVAWARCPESGTTPPFWPAQELGAQLRAAGVTTAELIVPPELTDAGAGPRARFELHQAVLRTIAGTFEPVVLVIDDLQWADADSLRLLEHVARDLATTMVLVVVTTRPLDDASPPALVDCLGELARVPSAVHVRLDRLGHDDVAAWLAGRTDVAVPPEVADLVHDRTGGHPLFVKELTDLLAAEGRLGDVAAVRSARAIPPGVQFVVRRRVARLPAATQQLLSIASIVGPAFDLDIVAAASERDVGEVLDDLDPAIEADLLRVDPNGGFRFSHALVAEALADEVNAARRARIHAGAARALAARGRDQLGADAALVAHHALEGLLAGTGDLAIEASTRAARVAKARFADEDAARHWGNVALALRRTRAGDVVARVDALVHQAKALLRADLVLAAKAPILEAIAVAEAAGFVDGMVQAAQLVNHAHVWTNEPYGVVDEELVAALEKTLAVMGDDDPACRADVLGGLASELVYADRDRYLAVCREAEDTARASGDPLTLARVLIDVQLPHAPAAHAIRRARSEEIVALAREHDLPHGVAFAGEHGLAQLHLEAGDVDGAIESLERCRAILRPYGGSRFRSQLCWLQASIAAAQGRYDEATKVSAEALEIHRRSRAYDAETLAIAVELVIAADRGGVDELLARMATTTAATSYTRIVAETAAWTVTELGQLDLAAAIVAPYGPDAPLADDWTTLCTATAALHVRAELGDTDGAAALVERLDPYAGRWSVAGSSAGTAGLTDLALARGRALLGDRDAARRHFADAVAGHERMRTPAWLARSLVHQGRFLLDEGDDAAGEAALARAAELADRHGLVYVARRLAER